MIAAARLDRRYAGLRADPEAQGWYPNDHIPEHLAEWRENLAPWLGKRGSAVELGCGAGNLSLDLAAEDWRVTGFDIAPNAAEWATERAQRAGLPAEFHARDLATPLSGGDLAHFGGSFDLALDASLFHYILPPHRAAYLANVRALLAPGGVFAVLTTVGEPEPEHWAMLGYDPATRISHHAGVPMTYHADAGTVRDELHAAGFTLLADRLLPRDGGTRAEATLFAAATLSL